MRRNDRKITDPKKIKEILDKCKIVSFAMWDGERPYAVIMNFGYEFTCEGKLRLFVHGALEGRKAEIIKKKCQKVAAVMECDERIDLNAEIPCKSAEAYKSIMAYGEMRLLKGEEAKRALEIFYKHQAGIVPNFPSNPEEFVNVYCLDCEEYSCKECVK